MKYIDMLTFEYLKPFRTSGGDIVTMKTLTTILDKTYVEVNENSNRYSENELTPISQREYQAHLDWTDEMAKLD